MSHLGIKARVMSDKSGAANKRFAGLIFLVFVLSRAIHPMIIDASKVNGKVLYSNNAPAILSQLAQIIVVNGVAFFEEGTAGVIECWKFKGMRTFGVLGLWSAFGDLLEMMSMGSLSGGVYQILLQSKLLITALMKKSGGTKQTELQWYVLICTTLAVSAFVIVDTGSSSNTLPIVGVLFVLAKVLVSCYAAVLSDSKLKGFAELSMSAKLSQMSVARTVVSCFLAAAMEPSLRTDGLFHNWNVMTVLVTLSFLAKSLLTLYLLKVLDSIQKNIGEALAVIVIFFGEILYGASTFDLSSFLIAVLLVALVRVYGVVGKAEVAARLPTFMTIRNRFSNPLEYGFDAERSASSPAYTVFATRP